jgi:putative glutamine amidotransferase
VSGAILVSASTPRKAATTVAALRAAGADPGRIRVVLPAQGEGARRLAAGAAGVVLGGGPDLHPRHFGEAVLADGHVAIQPDRDRLDLELLAGAREAAVPTWGICRGLQVANVFLGGTLWQDLPSQLGGPLRHDLDQPVDALAHAVAPAAPETRTGEILGRETARVNSRHHQAVRELAPALVAAGHAPDGLVEAVELADRGWWLRAVQWHPEDLVALPQQRALWREFLAAVGERGRRDGGAARGGRAGRPAAAAAGGAGR